MTDNRPLVELPASLGQIVEGMRDIRFRDNVSLERPPWAELSAHHEGEKKYANVGAVNKIEFVRNYFKAEVQA